MSNRSLSGSIALSKLVHAVQTSKKGAKCIVIPLDSNHIDEVKLESGKTAFYLNVKVLLREEKDQYGQDGFISHQVSSDKYKAASEEQKKAFQDLEILGNIKDFSGGGNETTNDAGNGKAFDQGDDLPF